MQKISLIALSSLLCAILFIASTGRALADGTETLGPPEELTLAAGTGIVASGIGTALDQPATINLTVPDGVTVKQVLLYWEGQMATNIVGDNTILVNGTEVTGKRIGGPAFFFKKAYSSAFRADITNLGVISAGANTVTVDGLNFSKVANGAGIMVIYDDGTTPAAIGLRDGVDLAYIGFPENEDRHGTIAQTISFVTSTMARTANVVIFASSVEGAISGQDLRPDSIEITVAGVTTTFSNQLNSNDGDEWDTLELQVDVPAGADNITIQLFSRDDEASGNTPASMAWIGTGFAIVPPTASIDIEKATNGEDADEPTGPQILVGEPVTWTYVVTNTGDVTLNNVAVTDDKLGAIDCPKTTLAPNEPMICTANGTAGAGQYANNGEVVGTPATGGTPVRDADPSHYFGVALAAVGDKVFRDANVNDLQDDGEPGVNSIIVELYNGNNTLISTTTTVDGMYLFDKLQPGDYYVKFINPTGSGTCTTPNVGEDDTIDSDGAPVADDARGPACQTATFSLVAGQTDLTRDLGLVYLAPSISLEKATNGEDADSPTGPLILVGDPVTWTYVVVNTGNVALFNVTVTDDKIGIINCPQTTLAPTESMTCTESGTAAAGQYANVATVVGTPEDESSDVSDSDPSHYFGYVPASVGNLVFGDINPSGSTPGDIAGGNGIQDGDPREQGIDGIIVKLYNSADQLISTTVTANGGLYLFDNLVPGEYCLVFVNTGEAGVWTIADQGDDAADSDVALPTTEPEGDAIKTPCFTLTSGQTDLTWDAGLIGLSGAASAAAGNRVWVDSNPDTTLNANGIQDTGELGYPNGVTVQIFTEANVLVQTTQTDSQGIYNFNALDPGSYYIQFTLPATCQLTQQNAGSDDENDSDVTDLVNNRTIVFTLAPFETNPTFDLGIVCPTGLEPSEEPLQNKIYLPFIS